MKSILLPIIFFLFCLSAFGQLSTAKLDADIFARTVMPSYDQELKKVQAYQDSLTAAISADPQYLSWKKDMEEVDKEDTASIERYYQAQQKINDLSDSVQRMINAEYQNRMNPALEAFNNLKGYQQKMNIDIVILYGKEGVQGVEYVTREKEQQTMAIINKCLNIPDGTKNEERLRLQNERLPGCQQQLMTRLMNEGKDITQAFIETLN